MEWSVNPLVAGAIGLAVLFFGYFFGLFEGRGQGYKKRKKEEAEEKKDQPAPIPLASPPVPSDETPILNLSMDTSGKLRLKMDGQQADTTALDSEQRKRLIAILTHMRPWLEAPKATAAPPSQPQSASSQMGTPTYPTQTTPPANQLSPDHEEDEPDAPPQSIVGQIDSVLQSRLAGTPLAGNGIRLQESLQGGVNVWVGLHKFDSVDEVPDETIKAAIKAAIKEWEDKYTPGL